MLLKKFFLFFLALTYKRQLFRHILQLVFQIGIFYEVVLDVSWCVCFCRFKFALCYGPNSNIFSSSIFQRERFWHVQIFDFKLGDADLNDVQEVRSWKRLGLRTSRTFWVWNLTSNMFGFCPICVCVHRPPLFFKDRISINRKSKCTFSQFETLHSRFSSKLKTVLRRDDTLVQ